MKTSKRLVIDPERWYPARETVEFLEVTEATITRYCRDGDLKKARQIGPKKRWHILGSELILRRKEWGLDAKR